MKFLIANWLTKLIPPTMQDTDASRDTSFRDFFFSGDLDLNRICEDKIWPKKLDEQLAEKIVKAARVFPSFRILLSKHYWNYHTETLKLLSDCLKIRNGSEVTVLPPMPVVIREVENSLYEIVSTHNEFSRYDIIIVFGVCGLSASKNEDHIIDHDDARAILLSFMNGRGISEMLRQYLGSADSCFERIYSLMTSLNRDAAFSALFKHEKAQSQTSDLKFGSKKLRRAFISMFDALRVSFEPEKTHEVFINYLLNYQETAPVGIDSRDHYQLDKAFDSFLFSAYIFLSCLPLRQMTEEIENIIGLCRDFSVPNRKQQTASIELLSDMLAEGFPLPQSLALECFLTSYGATAYPQQIAMFPQVLKSHPGFDAVVKEEIKKNINPTGGIPNAIPLFLEIYPYLPERILPQNDFFEKCCQLERQVWPDIDKTYRPETVQKLLCEAHSSLENGRTNPKTVYAANLLLVASADLIFQKDKGILRFLSDSKNRQLLLETAVWTDYGYRRIDRDYNRMLYDNQHRCMHIPCGAFRLLSAYEFDCRVALTSEETDYYRTVFDIDGFGRYGALQYRLLSCTDFFERNPRPGLKNFAGAGFLKYDFIRDFRPENYAENAAFLEDPRKLQLSEQKSCENYQN